MKILAPTFLSLSLALAIQAQAQNPTPAPSLSGGTSASTAIQRGPEALDTLLGPIALYPDALVALILPAATSPGDVVLAARYVQAKSDPAAVDAQPWSDSVKALTHYPDVVQWMDQNLEWTQALGQAFLDQPADVMGSVQRLRARAQASGALISTPQQHVLNDGANIEIVPAQPDIVYVPVYDPTVVYVQNTVWIDRPYLTFGFGYPIGGWFIYDCDWGRRNVWVVSRPADWRNHPQYWNQPGGRPRTLPGQPWRPPAHYHPRPVAPINAHPPTPRPIRLDPRNAPTTSRPAPSRTLPNPTRPGPNTPAMKPGMPNHPVSFPQARTQPVPPAPQPSPAPAHVAPVRPAPAPETSAAIPHPEFTPHATAPVIVAPPVTAHPTRPLNPDPIDRSHHQLTSPRVPRPVVTPAPAPAPNTEPAQPDPRKTKPAP